MTRKVITRYRLNPRWVTMARSFVVTLIAIGGAVIGAGAAPSWGFVLTFFVVYLVIASVEIDHEVQTEEEDDA